MTAAERWRMVAEEDYLASELESEARHEYIGGIVEAMAGGTSRHSDIGGNAFAALHSALRGKPCKPQNSDMKVRIPLVAGVRYYYPDALVVCEANPDTDTFQERPAVLIEVISESTRRIDYHEKLMAYTMLPSLDVYILIEQGEPLAKVYRRIDETFVQETHEGIDAVIPLPTVDASLALSEVYDGLTFEG